MPAKTPTASGISRLLAAAGFDRAVVTSNSRHHKENTEGFHVRKGPADVIVTHWPASMPPSARTSAYAEQERRHVRVMLEHYAHVIDDAGWRVELTALQTLHVAAPPVTAKED